MIDRFRALSLGAVGLLTAVTMSTTAWGGPQPVQAEFPADVVAVVVMPTPTTVGVDPALALTTTDPSQIVPGGSYDGVRITGTLRIGKGAAATSLTNCRIEGAIVTWSPVNLDSCTVTGGTYAYDTGGTINASLLEGRSSAFRPGTESMANAFVTETPWTVTNSYLTVAQIAPPAHTQAERVLGGVGITFRNVVFDTSGPFNGTQAADLNFIGKDLLCEDCWFVGFGGYAVYAHGPNNVFTRPRFADTHRFGDVFQTGIVPSVVDARGLDDPPTPTTAVPTTAVSTTPVPTTAAPTTAAPTTVAPTTTAPPTTAAPTTTAPTTTAPPTTAAPTTTAPPRTAPRRAHPPPPPHRRRAGR